MLKHNKKRNIGLLSEFVSIHIAKCLIENSQQSQASIDKVKNVWLSHVSPDSVLAKEYALFTALYETKVKEKQFGFMLMQTIKEQAKSLPKNIDEQKTRFLHEIRSVSDKNFFDHEVKDYRTKATIQILLNNWRENDPMKISQTLKLEEAVLEHLLRTEDESQAEQLNESANGKSVLEYREEDIDNLVVALMTKKFNEKYKDVLTETQRKIVNLYVFSKDQEERKEKLQETLRDIRFEALSYIEYEKKSMKDKRLAERLEKIQTLLEGPYKKVQKLDDGVIAFYMTVSKLKEELESDETA